MRGREPRVASGAVIAYRLFDIAYAIDLPKVEAAWAERTRTSSARARLLATPPKAMRFGVAPVEVTLEPVQLSLRSASVQASLKVRLFEFGVVTLAVHVDMEDLAWPTFVDMMNSVDERLGDAADNDVWDKALLQIRSIFAGALVRPINWTVQEDYLIGLVHAFDEPLSADEVQGKVDLVSLLSGEQRPLSPAAREDLLRRRFSYYTDDLAVITWDRAFIYEPRRDSDVVDVLEVANAQLLEMRYYDELLDAELPHMYDLIGRTQHATSLLTARRYANLARKLTTLVAEVTELTEKVDNALQVTEDVYLARVYAAALDLFRVPAVGAAVDRKLSIIRDTYTALYDQASAARGTLLEVVIVLLIAVEIVMALVRH